MKRILLAILIACSGCAWGQRLNRELYIYAYNDSVTIVDSPFKKYYFDIRDSLSDTFTYNVSTWLYYEVNHKGVLGIGRGLSSKDYESYIEYIRHDMLWEIWMDRGKRDYWLYDDGTRKRISFAHHEVKRPLLTHQ